MPIARTAVGAEPALPLEREPRHSLCVLAQLEGVHCASKSCSLPYYSVRRPQRAPVSPDRATCPASIRSGETPSPQARSVATAGGQTIASRARLPDALRSGRFHSMGSRGDSGYRADRQVSVLWDLGFAPLSCCGVRPLTGRPSADARCAAGCQALRRPPPGVRAVARSSVARLFRLPGRYALLPEPHPLPLQS